VPEQRLRWPNVEKAVRAWLGAETGRPVYTETPSDPPAEYFTVERLGGNRNDPIERDVDVEVTATARDRGVMWDLAADAESVMAALACRGVGEIYVDEVTEAFGFAVDPQPDQDARVARATFTLTVRPWPARPQA
jgi:hypothetical protein